jgi:antirestriction protein ArdC
VAGFQTWKSLGRYVKKGEKGIMILAPLFRRCTNESNEAEDARLDSNDSRMLTGFRAVYVFDESMTAGNPLPQIGSVNGDPGTHRERLEQFVRERGIALEYSEDIAPAKGVSEGGKIKLLPGQSPAETVATLVHEIAHERLHRTVRRASTTKRIRKRKPRQSRSWFVRPSVLRPERRARITSRCGMVTPVCCLRASNSYSAPPPKS